MTPAGAPGLRRRAWLAAAGAATLAGCAGARHRASPALQADATPRLATADLLADLALFRRALMALHPGLYRYTDADAVEAGFDALDRRWRAPQSLGHAFVDLSRLLATFRCGHSYPNFYNQPPALRAALFAGRDKLPLHLRWLPGPDAARPARGARLVVSGPVGGALPPGTELRAIDGIAAADALPTLLACVRGDGHNDHARLALLSADGGDALETFDAFWPRLFGARERVVLDTIAPDGASTRTVLGTLDLAERQAQRPAARPPSDASPPWSLQIDDGIARLTMPSWAVYGTRWDWRAWLGRACDRVAREAPRGFVVDLRGNAGGLDCGELLLARCLGAPPPPDRGERRVRFRRTPEDLRPVLDTWDPSFHALGEHAEDLGGGFLRLPPRAAAANAALDAGAPLRMPLLVLVDGHNSSATLQFARRVRTLGLGRLVGATTGGNQRGLNGSAFFFVRGPHTGLEVDLPLVAYHAAGNLPDAGLLPDVTVPTTPADIATGHDPVMARARALLTG